MIIVRFILCTGNSKSTEEEVPCETHKRSIINTIINGIDESVFESANEEIYSNEMSEQNSVETEFLEQVTSPFTEWLNDIVKSANDLVENNDDGDRDNVMYKPIFANDFVRLCKILPLWSGISCDLFELDEVTFSSGNAESDMKNVKQFLEDIIPCSSDIFVEEHIGMLKGGAIEASQHSNYVEFVGSNTQEAVENENEGNQSKNSNVTEVERNDENEFDTESPNVTPKSSCRDGVQPRGTHRCIKCRKAVHTLPCCSIDIAEDEAYGEARLCNACAEQNLATLNTKSSCRDGGSPGDAHRCIKCKKTVHILPCCSISIGDEEGYGEARLCNACNEQNPATLSQVSHSISEMEYNEPWNKTPKRRRSKFMQKAPNWNLNNNIQKKVKLGMLINGNRSNTTYKVDKNKSVAMTNTCAVDSALQVNTRRYVVLGQFNNTYYFRR